MITRSKIILCGLCFCLPILVDAQELKSISLDLCYKMAADNSTLEQRRSSSASIAESQVKNANSAYIPSASINAIGTYQSDIIAIPIPNVDPLPLGQYNITLDVEQLIWDGGASSKSKSISASVLDVEYSKLDIDDMNLKNRVASFFLSISLLKKNLDVLQLHIDRIKTNVAMMKGKYRDGIATFGNVIKLESEQVLAEQSLMKLQYDRTKMIESLSILMGQSISYDVECVLPEPEIKKQDKSLRPEYDLFDAQQKIINDQIKLLNTSNMPKISAFVKGGNGLPGLDMMRTTPEWYYMAGVKLNVPLTNWKSTTHQKTEFMEKQSLIDLQREDFSRNNNIEIAQSWSEIDKCREMISSDIVIVAKRKEVLDIEENRLENGMSTTNDYIIELNHYKEALMNQKLNEVRLVQAIVNYKLNLGDI